MKRINDTKILVVFIMVAILGWTQVAEAKANKSKKAKAPVATITLTGKVDFARVLRDAKPNPDGSVRGWLTKRIITTEAIEVTTHKDGISKVVPNGWAVKIGSEVTLRKRGATPTIAKPQPPAQTLGAGFDPEKIFRPGWRFLPDHGCWIGVITQDGSFDIKQLTIIDRTDKNRTLQANDQLRAGHEYKIFVKKPPVKVAPTPKVTPTPVLPVMTKTGSMIRFSRLGDYQARVVASQDLVTQEDLCLITTLALIKTPGCYYIPCPERDLCVPAGVTIVVNDVTNARDAHRGCVRIWQAQPGQIVKSQNLRSLEIYFPQAESLLADDLTPGLESSASTSVSVVTPDTLSVSVVAQENTTAPTFIDDGGELGIDASRADDLNGLFEVAAPNGKGFYIANSKNPEIKQKLLRACINLPQGQVISVKVRNQPAPHYYSDLFELKSVLSELGCELEDIQNIRIPAPSVS